MNPVPPLERQEITPSVFRASSLILETIERHGVSLDYAATVTFRRMRLKPGERGTAYRLSWSSLLGFAPADLLLERSGYRGLPLRRKNAFRVAYTLRARHGFQRGFIASVRGGLLGNKLLSLLSDRNIDRINSEIEGLSPVMKAAYKYSVPPLITCTLYRELGRGKAERIVASYAWRRVWARPASCDIERLERELKRLGIRYHRDRDIGFLYELHVKPWEELPRIRGAVYQDKASVLAVQPLLGAGGPIVDVAAAPLLKTHLLCVAREVVAVDVSEARLRRGLGIASHCRLLHTLVADSTRPPLLGRFAAALLDAPCTNSGALARDPGLRLTLWGLTREALREYSSRQRSLLGAALRLIGRGGYLLYSTCSVFPEEGEQVVEGAAEPVEPGIPGECGYGGACQYRRLFPDRGTTGFFIALLRRQ